MNKVSKITAIINSQPNPFHIRSILFHSSPVLERRRRTHWDSASNFRSSPRKFVQYSRKLRKQSLLRNINEFAEDLFQNWQSDRDEYDHPSGGGSSWFKPNFRDDGYKRGKSGNRTSRGRRRDFEFCDSDYDDIEFESIFQQAFGGTRHFYWSFTTDDDEPRFRNTSGYYSSNYRNSSRWHNEYGDDEKYDSSYEPVKPRMNMTSERLALGLSASGPLNVEDVKIAYRACALKWHPDRHQGSSKVVAEEKFKVCSAAYQTLCDKLAMHQ